MSGACPGDGGIVCCVKSATSPEPEPELDSTDAWPSCKTTLSCSFEAIASVTMSDRRTYVRTMQSYFFDTLNAGDQVRNVEGVITFFIDNDLGAPESWISYVDAGIVQGIQNGGAIALGMSAGTGGNPGSLYWADFFRGMRDGKLGDRDVSAHS